jgi:hypothetical protein
MSHQLEKGIVCEKVLNVLWVAIHVLDWAAALELKEFIIGQL